jgi:hypothetical protein
VVTTVERFSWRRLMMLKSRSAALASQVLPIELVDGFVDQLIDGRVLGVAEAAAPVSPAEKPACAPGALYLGSGEEVALGPQWQRRPPLWRPASDQSERSGATR